jgi:hypothetical protein
MERKAEAVVFTYFAFVAIAELLLHLLLASSAMPGLSVLYLSEAKRNSVTTLFDNFLPSIILGIANGWYGGTWPTRKICVSATLLGIGVVGLDLMYPLFFRPDQLWWWPPTIGDAIFRLITTATFLGMFTYAGVRGRASSK